LDNEHVEGDETAKGKSLPLCYASFELLKKNHKLTKAEKQLNTNLKWKQPVIVCDIPIFCGMKDSHNMKTQSLIQEPIFTSELQQPPLFLDDPISDYLDEFCSPSGSPLAVCEPENRGEEDSIWKTSLFCSSTVSLHSSQRSKEVLQPYHDNF
jgi:hypothetical protein